MEKLTVIFLIDRAPPRKIVMLKRGPEREFAPNKWTGIGGKVEKNDKDQYAGAVRELSEETSGSITVNLTEFARVNINNSKILCYFWGICKDQTLPKCPEGELEWIPIEKIFDREVIPTTLRMLLEWKNRNWSVSSPFTIFLKRVDINDASSHILSQNIGEGLMN